VGPVPITVNCPTTVATTLSATSIATGGSVSDQATITGAAPTAGGTITYTVYSDNICKTVVADATPSPNTVVNGGAPASKSITFNSAGTFYWQAVYSGDPSTNTLANSSNCTDEQLVVISRQVSQITPTQTTCAMFQSGTAATLSEVDYSTRSGQISQVAPGVFFYWVKVQVTSAGNQTFTISQSVSTPSNFFQWAPGSFAYDANCNTLKTTVTQIGAITTVQFSTTSAEGAGTYYIGVKYRTSNVLGEPTPSPSTVVYTFTTGSVSGSTSQLSLVQTHSH
jgi:archaellum component FlaG (FlaF/FlaG flagellin family)